MAFTTDDGPFRHIGPVADEGGVTEISPGRTIQDEVLSVVRNGHILWTNANRARLLSLSAWGYWGTPVNSQQPWASESAAVSTLHAVCPVAPGDSRDDWTVVADLEEGEVYVLAYDSGGVLLDTGSFASIGRDQNQAAAMTGVATAAYVEIYLAGFGLGDDVLLYSLHIYEDETAT